MRHPCQRRWLFRWLGKQHTWNGEMMCAHGDAVTPQCGAAPGVYGVGCTKRKGHAYEHRAVTSTTRTNGRITAQTTSRWGGERDPQDDDMEFFEEGPI